MIVPSLDHDGDDGDGEGVFDMTWQTYTKLRLTLNVTSIQDLHLLELGRHLKFRLKPGRELEAVPRSGIFMGSVGNRMGSRLGAGVEAELGILSYSSRGGKYL
jgi:hypothetical protein